MKRAVSVFLVLIMVFTASVAVFANDIKPVNKVIGYENNELLVMYKDGSVDVINYGTTEELRCGIAQYSCDENIIICQPNYSYETVGALTGDEYAYEQWALFNDGTFAMEEGGNQFPVYDTPFGPIRLPYEWKIPDFFGIPGGFFGKEFYITKREVKANPGIDIGMSAAWNTYRNNGREVIVAVVDTGVEYSHEDLKNRMWINTDEIPGNGIDDDWNGYTDDVHGWNFYDDNNIMYTEGDDDHGTHCAGTIVADANNGVGIAGVNQANNIKIMNVKALGGSGGYGTTGSVIRAIQYAEANGATICNLSLGTSINHESTRIRTNLISV